MTDIVRVTEEDRKWTARVRYEHKFDDDTITEEVDASHVAQGATANVRDGRVETVVVPDGELRTEDDVRDIARAVTRDIEGESA